MNKTVSIIITLGLVVALGIVFLGGNSKTKESEKVANSKQSVEIKNGIQYITIDAKGGYSPKMAIAQGGIPTKLIVKTNGTFDCSASLLVRSVGFQKILPPTGETEIDLGVPKSGEPLVGVCGMGMYNFQINFT
jgi:plastocyanin domain-containing protein